MTTVKELKDKRDDLVLCALDLALLIRPYDPDYKLPESPADDQGALLTTFGEDGWLSPGEVQKKAGVDLTPDAKFVGIQGYGSKPDRRRLKESEDITLAFTAQETRKLNSSLFYDVSLSAWRNVPGGHAFTKSSDAETNYFSVLAIGHDRYRQQDVFPFWMFGKMSADKAGKLQLQDNAEMGQPITLAGMEHPTAGLFTHGIVGPGWLDLSHAAGFVGAASAPWTVEVTGAPTGGTFTLTLAGETTKALAYNATALDVKAALEALASVGIDQVQVTGTAGGPYTIAFDSTITGSLTASGTKLTGGTSPTVTTTQAASPA